MAHLPIKDHIAIITGSAQGFGKEFAERLLQKGAKVCISDINETLGLETLKELQEKYECENVTFFKCDVSKSQDWSDLWSHTEEKFQNQVTLLVNNAGLCTFLLRKRSTIDKKGTKIGQSMAKLWRKKWTKSAQKVDQKCTENAPKIDQKWTKKRPKMD